jgi:ABC-2 type transport system permease protein
MIKRILANFRRYQFLLKQLIIREFKKKYKRSVLGVLWSLLYPILMMLVMAMVFSRMLRVGDPNVDFFVYYEIGFVMFNFFSESTNAAMYALITNFPLLRKIYIPKYILPLSKVLSCGINFLLTLIPLFGVVIIRGAIAQISWWYLLIPVIFLMLLMFTTGWSLLLSCLSVFFRDMFHIHSIFIMIWNYATPVFYSISLIPERWLWLFRLNPLYVYIDAVRTIILYGACPSLYDLFMGAAYAVVVLGVGAVVFRHHQDQFIYYA